MKSPSFASRSSPCVASGLTCSRKVAETPDGKENIYFSGWFLLQLTEGAQEHSRLQMNAIAHPKKKQTAPDPKSHCR
jgi:hypothetical protein